MTGEGTQPANAGNDKAQEGHVEIIAPQKVNKYIPDFLQNTIMEKLKQIDDEIRIHENALKELNREYMAHANFLMRYNPFGAGYLSQDASVNIKVSPGAAGAPGGEEEHEKDVADPKS